LAFYCNTGVSISRDPTTRGHYQLTWAGWVTVVLSVKEAKGSTAASFDSGGCMHMERGG